jgi:ribonuclease HI
VSDYTLTFDGGASNNGRAGRSYGSYQLKTAGGKSEIARLEFEDGTSSNEAEYKSLVAGLTDLLDRINGSKFGPGQFTVEIVGDSQLVLYQVNTRDDVPQWRCNEQHLMVHRDKAREMLGRFKDWRDMWVRREYIVGVLGH